MKTRDPRPQLCHTTRGRHRSQSAVTSEGVRSASPFALMSSCERQPDHRRAAILRQRSHAREEDATRRHDRPFQGRARVPVARRRAMLGGQLRFVKRTTLRVLGRRERRGRSASQMALERCGEHAARQKAEHKFRAGHAKKAAINCKGDDECKCDPNNRRSSSQ